MTTVQFLKREIQILVILAVPVIYLLIVWDRLPDRLPIHWNIKGEADNYGPKYMMGLLNIGLYLLLLIVPKIDPRRRNYDIFSSTYYKLRLVLMLLFGVLSLAIITSHIGFDIDMGRVIVISFSLFFTILGNYMGTIKPNWFIGIRLPWTLESETVWRKTHQLAGKLWFWTGLMALVSSFFFPNQVLHPLLFFIIIAMTVIPAIYSYVTFQKEKQSVSGKDIKNSIH